MLEHKAHQTELTNGIERKAIREWYSKSPSPEINISDDDFQVDYRGFISKGTHKNIILWRPSLEIASFKLNARD